LPDVDANIWQKYRDQGVLVYGLHPGDDAALVAAFVEQTGISYPVVNSQGTLGKFAFPPGVGYPYPRDVVIGKDLRVRSISNSFNVDDMDTLVQQLLAQ
jgi:hypothetical protein